jgi:hypothetical protein
LYSVKEFLSKKHRDHENGVMQRNAIRFTGLIWVGVGALLLRKGIVLCPPPLLFFGIAVGFLKGRFILKKTAERIAERIFSLQTPFSLFSIYPASYWLLLGGMIALGGMMKLAPPLIRGFVDTAVGCALVTGSIFYFKLSATKRTLPENKSLL